MTKLGRWSDTLSAYYTRNQFCSGSTCVYTYLTILYYSVSERLYFCLLQTLVRGTKTNFANLYEIRTRSRPVTRSNYYNVLLKKFTNTIVYINRYKYVRTYVVLCKLFIKINCVHSHRERERERKMGKKEGGDSRSEWSEYTKRTRILEKRKSSERIGKRRTIYHNICRYNVLIASLPVTETRYPVRML